MKVVVIGCTHAGTVAVKSTLKDCPEAETTAYERNDNTSLLSCGVVPYVGEVTKDPTGLLYSNPEESSSLRAAVKMEHDVTDINTENGTVTAKDLKVGKTETASYDKLVMTAGPWPVAPPISRVDAKNVPLRKNYDQANEIVVQAKEAKRAVIVGGGYIGIELVEAFVESEKQITLIDGLNRILNRYLDKPFTDILEKELIDRGVTLTLGESVTEFITDEEGKVKQIATPADTSDTDMVISCVGFCLNTRLIEGRVGTLPNGAIKANEYMQTSDPDIFAVGDSAVVNCNPSDTQDYIPLVTNAVCQGLLVENNLIEHKMAYCGAQGTSGLYLFGRTTGPTGATRESATLNDLEVRATVFEDNYRPEFMPTTGKVMMGLVYEEGTNRIVGAQLMSKYDIT